MGNYDSIQAAAQAAEKRMDKLEAEVLRLREENQSLRNDLALAKTDLERAHKGKWVEVYDTEVTLTVNGDSIELPEGFAITKWEGEDTAPW